jgi:hypothetical protein
MMKHKGPLGLFNPKMSSYWDFKNFDIFLIFLSFLSFYTFFKSFLPYKCPFWRYKFCNLMGEEWGRGGDGTWRHFGLKLTKKRKTFKGIDFKNFNISSPIFSRLFSQKNALLKFFFLKISWGRGWREVWMKHEGPLGLYNPKTFSYWDLKNFNILNLITIFQRFLSHFSRSWAVGWCDGPANLQEFVMGMMMVYAKSENWNQKT